MIALLLPVDFAAFIGPLFNLHFQSEGVNQPGLEQSDTASLASSNGQNGPTSFRFEKCSLLRQLCHVMRLTSD